MGMRNTVNVVRRLLRQSQEEEHQAIQAFVADARHEFPQLAKMRPVIDGPHDMARPCVVQGCQSVATLGNPTHAGIIWYCRLHLRMCAVDGCGNATNTDVSALCYGHWLRLELAYRCGHLGAILVAPERASNSRQQRVLQLARQHDCEECAL